MNDQEFENLIRNNRHTDITPSREGFRHMLSTLGTPVTESEKVRYTRETTQSNIINMIIHSMSSIRLVAIPSLIVVLVIGGYAIRSKQVNSSALIEQLANENEAVEEPSLDLDDGIVLTSFDTPMMNDLTNNQNEIIF